jgi:hypothetical protein
VLPLHAAAEAGRDDFDGGDVTERRLGSTEIACVAALYLPQLEAELPKTKTVGDVWLRLVHGLDTPKRKPMQRGLDMEPWALDYYAEHVGPWWRAKPVGQFWTVPHPTNPDFTASPDAYDAPNGSVVVEIKTQVEWARKQWGTPGTSEMANRFLYQCAWLMACCEREETHVLCVFGNEVPVEGQLGETEFIVTQPAIYPCYRDRDVERMLLELGERFMDEFVRPRVPPPVLPANNRRKAKELVDAEQGKGAAAEWYSRCAERSRELADGDSAEARTGDEVG